MRRKVAVLISIIAILSGVFVINSLHVYAAEEKEILTGKTYDLGDDDEYELIKAEAVSDKAGRFYLNGDISEVSTKNGFASYAVDSGNLKLMVDKTFGTALFQPQKEQDWHIVTDKSKVLDGTKLAENIGSGAIVVQTSKDGKVWINADTETDIYEKMDTLNERITNGEQMNAFYNTSNIQITNGCYYRIIVAYKLQRTVYPSKILFVEVKNTEQKERLEIYEFYAYNPNVNQAEKLAEEDAYEFSDVYRVDKSDGFKNPTKIKSEDPHNDWKLGKFYISGYTDVMYDRDIPVFLKVPGDKAALWFNLEHALDKCNGRTDIKVDYISSGSDTYFETPEINNFGRGTLIIRKTDKNNKKKRYIYTNYLEASASVGANTRVDLFEEGDYEVALDYQLHYDKPFVFGTTSTKLFSYRVFFEFKVRNGDVSAFIRDVDTDQFITNADIAENGFYIDVANSQYLTLSIKREVLSESLDGVVEDTKFLGVAKEGRHYTDDGIYTVTVKNQATGDSVEKKVYVGDSDVLKAHVATGISISEINERLAAGAYIDENGHIIDSIHGQSTETESGEIVKIKPDTEKLTDIDKVEEMPQKPNRDIVFIALIAVITVFGITFALVKKKKDETTAKEVDIE